MSKYLINAIGLALVAAGQSMQSSAAAMQDVSGFAEVNGDGTGTVTQDPYLKGITDKLAPATIAAAELDGEGLPWDDRIHASTKTKTAQNLWTKKKGVDDITRATVVKQLREKYPAAQPQQTQLAAMPAAPTGAAVPVATIPGMTLPSLPLTPYQELCQWLAANTGEGKMLPAEWVTQQFANAQTSLAELATADATLLKQWLDAMKGVLAQMQQ